MRALLSRPSSFESHGGFAEQRPLVPQQARELSPEVVEAARRVAEGGTAAETIAATETLMWDSIREAME